MSKDMKGYCMGDWVDTKDAKQAETKGIEGCPTCEGRGTYQNRRTDFDGGTFSERLICMRCVHHTLILQRLLGLSHEDLKIVWDLVHRFEGKDLELKKANEGS